MSGRPQCNYYGNVGENVSGNYCQNVSTHDHGRFLRVSGLPYKVRYACDEHAPKLGFRCYRDCVDTHYVGPVYRLEPEVGMRVLYDSGLRGSRFWNVLEISDTSVLLRRDDGRHALVAIDEFRKTTHEMPR